MELSDDELRLLIYWRTVCHIFNEDTCPLHLKCLEEKGIDFCHNLVTKIIKKREETKE